MTMDAGSLTLLHRLIALGSRSLLQYVSEAFPWSADPTHSAEIKVRALAAAERDEAIRLTRWLQKQHVRMPPPASYPSHFTTINFCSLSYLLPMLIAENEREIAEIERQLPLAENDEEAHKLAHGYLDMKREHLRTLQDLADGKPSAVTHAHAGIHEAHEGH